MATGVVLLSVIAALPLRRRKDTAAKATARAAASENTMATITGVEPVVPADEALSEDESALRRKEY